MCGRYNLRASPAELQEFFDLFRDIEDDWSPRYNIALRTSDGYECGDTHWNGKACAPRTTPS